MSSIKSWTIFILFDDYLRLFKSADEENYTNKYLFTYHYFHNSMVTQLDQQTFE